MERQKLPVLCPENEELAGFMWHKRLEMAERPKGISENIDMTLYKAYFNVCNSETSIKSLKDLSLVKGVGKWILKQVQGFFKNGSEGSEPESLTGKGKKTKGARRYVPQKNSVAYALLITLYRGATNGNEYMRKQELIESAEASGLSRVAIAPEKGKGKLTSQFGSSPREWYSGWSCMKTLISRGLVVKSSCPAKYMLTQEGHQVAHECLARSGLTDPTKDFDDAKGTSVTESRDDLDNSSAICLDSDTEVTSPSVGMSRQNKSIDVPRESLERFMQMGYSKHQVLRAFEEVSRNYPNKDISSLWLEISCHLREDQVYGQAIGREKRVMNSSFHKEHMPKTSYLDSEQRSFTLRGCSSSDRPILQSCSDGIKANSKTLSMPPLSFGEKFEDVYNVVLILDDREQFANHGSRSRRMIENICSQFKIQIEISRLPVGDGIWIARHKHLDNEYVLDFVVERKNIDDFRCSIRDNRYRDQKLKLLRCGLKKIIYLVEGDPNSSEAAESIKTACFTTEISEGFDVQRTSGLSDTLKKYGYLTRAIAQYYKSLVPDEHFSLHNAVCPRRHEFIKRCQELDKMTVSDVFALQLMQVPQVTEEIAVAVLDLYPTLLSLARAYSLLDGDVIEQEEMLRKQSNNSINASASRNIFHLIWGSGQL